VTSAPPPSRPARSAPRAADGRRRWAQALVIAVTLLACATRPVEAQLPGIMRPGGGGARPSGGGSRQPGDSVKPLHREKKLIDFTPPDSTMRALLAREGYRSVIYQGDKVRFEATERQLRLSGEPAGVKRDETILVGSTIDFNDSTQMIVARGDTVVLRDPSQQDGDDVVARTELKYDLQQKRGVSRALRTSFAAGERWYVQAAQGAMLGDTVGVGAPTMVMKKGVVTSCDLEDPHYSFEAAEGKVVSRSIMLLRNVKLRIGEVPVLWLPFIFQDMRPGRRSGFLPPLFGIGELVRNSPTYRREVRNIGYFFALSEYTDLEVSVDWRSGAGAGRGQNSGFGFGGFGLGGDPGFTRYNSEFRYRWLDRFVAGRFAYSRDNQRDGRLNQSVTWNHSQDFSKATRLTTNINWTQNTQIQRQNQLNPIAALGTIVSQGNFQTARGPVSLNLGGSRRQYPGRPQVDFDFPSVNLTSKTIAKKWFEWTPALNYSATSTRDDEQGLGSGIAYSLRADGGIDSTRVRGGKRADQYALNTPIKIGDFQLQLSVNGQNTVETGPRAVVIQDPVDPSRDVTRVYNRVFQSRADWTFSFNLPRFLQGLWNISPNLSFANTDGSNPFWIRSILSDGRWVQQSKRPSLGLSAAPTLYGLFRGIGPVARLRHSINPSFSYNWSPRGTVSDEFLRATNNRKSTFIGALPRSVVSMTLAQNIEAKLRAPRDSAPDQGKKIRLLSLNASSLSWDFIRADTLRKAGKRGTGLVENNFSLSARSDLLPGLDFNTAWELYQGNPISDTAIFRPFRTNTAITFALDGQSRLIQLLGRLLGIGVAARGVLPDSAAGGRGTSRERSAGDAVFDDQAQSLSAAGRGARLGGMMIPGGGGGGQGFRANLSFNSNRMRPIVGGNVLFNDPERLCEPQRLFGQFAFDQCVLLARQSPPPGANNNSVISGSPLLLSPPTETMQGNLSFPVTQNWSAQWSTTYDLVRKQFAAQQVTFNRRFHDWDAIFNFTTGPTGTAFNFFISLRSQPDIKFDYRRNTFRQSSTGF
jgi:hypothetical protein